MDVTGGVAATKTLLSIAAKIAAAVTRANDEKLEPERRVVLYLEVAREAVNALGLERQRILSMARRCNIRKPKQVEALWARLDTYLHEDNVRPQLEKAVRGLQACAEPIKKHTEGIKWRKRDKQAAVAMFLSTCGELEQVLTELAHHFYPGSSGMGVGTLLPIEHQLREIRDFQREKEKIDPGVEDEKLAELISKALRDPTQTEWILKGGKVESLITELSWAFRLNVVSHGPRPRTLKRATS